MIKPIVTNPLQLNQVAQPATALDQSTCQDLRDTLKAHQAECVGMAANMIGINKRIIIAEIGPLTLVMLNPVITKQAKPYRTQEGCLSLIGECPTNRFETITVNYRNEQFQTQTQTFTGFSAQIIQHEIDHCDGIVI